MRRHGVLRALPRLVRVMVQAVQVQAAQDDRRRLAQPPARALHLRDHLLDLCRAAHLAQDSGRGRDGASAALHLPRERRRGEERGMNLGVFVEGQEGMTWGNWQRWVRMTEDLGFESIWRSDHLYS